MSNMRRLDHTVLCVDSLDGARDWFERFGFIVAPDADHPFGTTNACIFLADGTYIEPLAVGHRETCEAAAREGNAFIARDQAHRFRVGTPSFSAVAFASRDADGDRDDLEEAGFGAGEMLAFERRFQAADGSAKALGFRLAFARDLRAPDVSFFTCQPTHLEKPDRAALAAHPNGVTGTARLVMSEPNPTDFQYYLQHLTGDREGAADSFAMTLRAEPAVIEVATPRAMAMRYGAHRAEARGLSFDGIVLKARSLADIHARADAAGIALEERQGRLVASLAPGAFIGFEEDAS